MANAHRRSGALLLCWMLLGCGHGGSASDAGETLDAGPAADAGERTDAGAWADAGTGLDAGVGSDGGENVDAGTDTDGGQDAGGCAPADLQSDVTNCGACGHACAFPHATARCQSGNCALDACEAGYVDADQDAGTGCEYLCVPTTDPTEVCDGVDNDCNGAIDDAPTDADLGTACGDPCPGGTTAGCIGACRAGTLECSGGAKICTGGVGPSVETCDGVDNDCNGQVDDPFTADSPFGYAGGDGTKPLYNSDPDNCGGCALACHLSNAQNGCHSASANAQGNCFVTGCDPGYAYVSRTDSDPAHPSCNVITPGSRDSTAGNPNTGLGCFYLCPAPISAEVCNGVDDNCDGCIDNGVSGGCPP